jgi:DUF971 family protein|tara:strand:- start:3 stop:329 length:327 start_codon:yes stop_codon:yes gene_type:complete
MKCWPLSLEKLDNGKNLKIIFDDNVEFIICSELLRVESPSAEVQGHSGPKKIIRNKKDITIKKIEQIGNYAIRLIFSDDHSSGIYSWELLYNYGKNQKILLEQYYNSL